MEATKKRSLLLITVDCLRADHVGFMGYDRPTTPFLDSLAKESCVIPAAIVGGAPTYYSVPSILASRSPLDLGRDRLGLAPGEETLASTFRDAGYATAAFCAGNPYISPRFGCQQGFDTFEDFLSADVSSVADQSIALGNGDWKSRVNRAVASISHRLGPMARVYDELYFQYCQRWATPPEKSLAALRRFPAADVIVNAALAWLSSLDGQPFFLWLHLMDPHSPYYPAEQALEAIAPGRWTAPRARYENSFWNRGDLDAHGLSPHREDLIQLYDAGILWVDTQIARLVQALKASERWEECALVATADHGEEFLDHDGRYHPPANLREELIHVPLLMRMPGVVPRTQSNSAFSLLHLAPTLLAALDIAVPQSFRGRSLWPQLQAGEAWDFPAIAESVAGCTNPFLPENRLGSRVLVVREARYKLVLYFHPFRELLFDLQRDPREQTPLAPGDERAVRGLLLEAAREHLHRSLEDRDLQASLRSGLRDLQLEWAMLPVQPVGS